MASYLFFKKGGESLPLRDFDPYLPELACLLTGIKPLVYFHVNLAELGYLETLCSRLSLHYLLCPKTPKERVEPGKTAVLLGISKEKLKQGQRVLERGQSLAAAGLLGYPRCCRRFHFLNSQRFRRRALKKLKKEGELVHKIYENTPQRKRLPFLLNNVLNFFSRIDWFAPEKDIREMQRILHQNRPLTATSFHLLPWHPCSYSCQESLSKARRIYSFLEKHVPDFASMLTDTLAKPVLFLDKHRFLIFEGKAAGNRIVYSGVRPPHSLIGKKLLSKILTAQELELRADGLVLRPRSSSGSFAALRGAILLNFDREI